MKWVVLLLLAACGPATKVERVRDALARFPNCVVVKEAGTATVSWTCSSSQCAHATCSERCAIRDVRLINASGNKPIEKGRAREVLDLEDPLSDVDAAEIDQLLNDATIAFDPLACSVR